MTEEILPHKNLSLENLLNEEWRDIAGFEGYYQISSLGRAKSLQRKVYIPSRDCYQSVRERILKQKITSSAPVPTLILKSSELEISREVQVSRLVAEHFLTKTKDETCVFHKDLDCYNNNVINLFWETKDYFSEIQKQHKDKRKNKRGKFGNTYSKYKGVTKVQYFVMQIASKKDKLAIIESFGTEIEAAKKYDFYIDKFDLKRRRNFESN